LIEIPTKTATRDSATSIVTQRAFERLLAEKDLRTTASPRQLSAMALEDGWAWLSLPREVLLRTLAAAPGAPAGRWPEREIQEVHFGLNALRLGVLMASGGSNGEQLWRQIHRLIPPEVSDASWALLEGKPVDWQNAGGLISVVGPSLEETVVAGIRGDVRVYECGVCGRIGQAGDTGPLRGWCSDACKMKAYRKKCRQAPGYA
jgi:hypothetical protein